MNCKNKSFFSLTLFQIAKMEGEIAALSRRLEKLENKIHGHNKVR